MKLLTLLIGVCLGLIAFNEAKKFWDFLNSDDEDDWHHDYQ